MVKIGYWEKVTKGLLQCISQRCLAAVKPAVHHQNWVADDAREDKHAASQRQNDTFKAIFEHDLTAIALPQKCAKKACQDKECGHTKDVNEIKREFDQAL